MSGVRACIVVVLLGLGVAGCGDDLPDPPRAGGSSSGTTGTTGTSTTDGFTSTSTSAAPASSDEAGTTTTGTTGPSSVGIPDECTVSADCLDGEPYCVAPFDQSAGPEGKGAYECVSECVVLMDEDRWCADAAACCDPQAECTDRGYCVYPEEPTGGSEGSGSSDGSTGGSTG
jgi:hypothetical protein